MRRIVLDTNVIISALLFGGNPRQILLKIINGEIRLGISPALLEKLREVLSRKKFNLTEQFVEMTLYEIEGLGDPVFPRKKIKLIDKDPEDNKVLECALEYKADMIISGDEHILGLGTFRGIPILTPAKYLDNDQTLLF